MGTAAKATAGPSTRLESASLLMNGRIGPLESIAPEPFILAVTRVSASQGAQDDRVFGVRLHLWFLWSRFAGHGRASLLHLHRSQQESHPLHRHDRQFTQESLRTGQCQVLQPVQSRFFLICRFDSSVARSIHWLTSNFMRS